MAIKRFNQYFLLLIAVLFSFLAKAQNDDHQDARKKTESFSRLQPKDLRADVATFALAGISESIGTLPLKKITYKSFSSDSMAFEGDGVKLTVKTARFDPSKHKLSYDFDDKYLVRIDKKAYYGDYGKVPKTYISSVTMTIGNDTVFIPPAAYGDLYNLNFTYTDKGGVRRTTNAIYQSGDGNRYYVYLFCKNNSGSYEVTWIIQDKKYLRRVLDYGFM